MPHIMRRYILNENEKQRQSFALPLFFYIRFFSSTLSCSLILLITRHGLPAAKCPAGISRVTTLPAPITQPSPSVTPPHTVTFPASQQLLPMLIGFAYSKSYVLPSGLVQILRSLLRKECIGVSKLQFGPKNTLSPIVTGQQSRTVKLKFA